MAKSTKTPHSYDEKLQSAHHDARLTVIALAVIVVAWLACGFGLAGVDVKLAGIPLWVWGGTCGTWIVAIVVACVLAKWGFADFDLDDAEDTEDEEATEESAGNESAACADACNEHAASEDAEDEHAGNEDASSEHAGNEGACNEDAGGAL